MATFLVTGGAGFIGSNIVRGLVRRGHKVRVLDNLSTGTKENLAASTGRFVWVQGDIRDVKAVAKCCQGVDYILHHAALRAVERSVDTPLETNEVNITGTLNILEAARQAKVKRVVFASSSAVYGDSRISPQTERLSAQPASPYALSKLVGEHYCRLWWELYGLPTVSLRYFNVFGPGQNPESQYSLVIPIFVRHLLDGNPPEIHWHGQQSRDFVYIGNVVNANLQAITAKKVKFGGVYNIGNGQTTSISDLYQQLQELLGISLPAHHGPKRPGDVLTTRADIRKAKRDLGYTPRVSFAEGLKKSIAWYKTHL